MKKRFIRPNKIEQHAKRRYPSPNSIQETVLARLTDYMASSEVRVSRAAIGYLFDEVEDEAVADVSSDRAEVVLGELLSETEKYRTKQNELSYAVLVRTLRVYECPKPWC